MKKIKILLLFFCLLQSIGAIADEIRSKTELIDALLPISDTEDSFGFDRNELDKSIKEFDSNGIPDKDSMMFTLILIDLNESKNLSQILVNFTKKYSIYYEIGEYKIERNTSKPEKDYSELVKKSIEQQDEIERIEARIKRIEADTAEVKRLRKALKGATKVR